jgi:hypothetical protein
MSFKIVPTREFLLWDCTRWVRTIESLSCVHGLVYAAFMSLEVGFEGES